MEIVSLESEYKRMTAEIKELREALEIYADQNNWKDDDWGILSVFQGGDRGYGNPTFYAKEALK